MPGPVAKTRRLTAVQRDKAEENLGLARKAAGEVAKELRNRMGGDEDAVHEAVLGVCNAARLFDPGRKLKFSTYAFVAAKRAVYKAANTAGVVRVPDRSGGGRRAEKFAEEDRRARGVVSLDRLIRPRRAEGGGEPFTLEVAERRAAPPAADYGDLELALGRLSREDRDLLERRYWGGQTLLELAAGRYTKERARQKLKRAHERLRAELEKLR